MPFVDLEDRRIYVEDTGAGPPVLLVPGTGARGHTWTEQVHALVAAGYRAVTMDNRGSGRSGPVPPRLTVTDLLTDVRDVAKRLFDEPYRLVGHSMGAYVVQEHLCAGPPVTQAALFASRARPDAFSARLAAAERALHDAAPEIPAAYDAVVRAALNLSPHTLADDAEVSTWLDLFELTPRDPHDAGRKAQSTVDWDCDRRADYARITCECLVVSFTDDMLAPPAAGRELARAIPGASFVEVGRAGHIGMLERPDEVNSTLLEFFGE
ncbi:alpha/beta fold hydrolase [Mangrovihabitans endophyticus]|nr:alpha/beta hydrolase [Mangrovihabitans endophyticus]